MTENCWLGHNQNKQKQNAYNTRSLVKSAYQKNDFLISQPKHTLWVVKRTVSLRQFFWAPKTYVQADGFEKIYNFTLKNLFI